MKLIKFIAFLPMDVGMTLLTMILNPFIAVGIYFGENNRLPKWLWLWQTPDDDAIGSNEHRIDWARKYPLYFQCLVWLYRNSGYGFAWYVIGAKVPESKTVIVIGDVNTNSLPYHPGYRVLLADNAFELFLVFPMPKDRCFRLRMGWKLDRWLAGNFSMPAQFVFSPNPWKARS